MDKERLKKQLLDLKQQLTRSVEATNAENTQPDGSESQSELSFYDNHPADIATDVFKREHDMAISRNAMDIISSIESALEKLENGRYGYCERCGREIGAERLELVPYTRFCVSCQAEIDNRPVRSQVGEVNALKRRKKVFREIDTDEVLEETFSSGSSSMPSEVGRHRDFKDLGYHEEFEDINRSWGNMDLEDRQ